MTTTLSAGIRGVTRGAGRHRSATDHHPAALELHAGFGQRRFLDQAGHLDALTVVLLHVVHLVFLPGESEGMLSDSRPALRVGLPNIGGGEHPTLDAAGHSDLDRILRHFRALLLLRSERNRRRDRQKSGAKSTRDHESSTSRRTSTIPRSCRPVRSAAQQNLNPFRRAIERLSASSEPAFPPFAPSPA